MGLQGVRRLDLLGVPQFTRVDIAIANKHFGSGKKKTTYPRSSRASHLLLLSIKVTWVSGVRVASCRLPPASSRSLPTAPSPARYNYSPLIRPGPGKRLPQGGQSLWLPTAPASPSPRPQLSHWATSQASHLLLAWAHG